MGRCHCASSRFCVLLFRGLLCACPCVLLGWWWNAIACPQHMLFSANQTPSGSRAMALTAALTFHVLNGKIQTLHDAADSFAAVGFLAQAQQLGKDPHRDGAGRSTFNSGTRRVPGCSQQGLRRQPEEREKGCDSPTKRATRRSARTRAAAERREEEAAKDKKHGGRRRGRGPRHAGTRSGRPQAYKQAKCQSQHQEERVSAAVLQCTPSKLHCLTKKTETIAVPT